MNGTDQISTSHTLSVDVTMATTLAVVGIVAAAATLHRLRGTTLVGVQCWLAACLAAIAAVELGLGLAASDVSAAFAETLRYVAATLTFCPLMALMGAKRPQDRAWHFIVASLWIVLALPALHVALLRPGQSLTIPTALAYFMMGMVVIGFLNRMMTRNWLVSVLFAGGQLALVSIRFPFVTFADGPGEQFRPLVGLALIATSCVAGWWGSRQGRTNAEPLDRLWLEFRDLFGVFWALRLAERVNALASVTKSNVVLRWSGFQTTDGGKITDSLSREAIQLMRQGLENLLRRFVSRDWIAKRLQGINKSDRSGA